MAASLRLFLDLGDIFTKGIAVSGGRSRRFVFPSVVARRLLSGETGQTDLLLDDRESLLRLADFDPEKYPRTRSYPREDACRHEIQSVPRARYAGRLAVALGADRQLLGRHPTEENIDALVHRAFFRSAEGCRTAEVIFILDVGAKAQAILRYAEASPRSTAFLKWKIRSPRPVLIQLRIRGRVVDAADCAAAALPPGVSLQQVQRLLLLDIGYLRTKLAIMSTDGCEHQEQLDGLGVSDCIRRILRDGQEQVLVEDEYAVIKALERSHGTIEVAGRRFEIGDILDRARRGVEEELARAARRAVADHFGKSTDACKVVAIIGGGAAVIGKGVAARIKELGVGLDTAWISGDTRFFLLGGARRIDGQKSRLG
jgi:hypothetical protein